MGSCNISEQNDELLQHFCVYTKNAIEESLRNLEEGKNLDYISYHLEHTCQPSRKVRETPAISNEKYLPHAILKMS